MATYLGLTILSCHQHFGFFSYIPSIPNNHFDTCTEQDSPQIILDADQSIQFQFRPDTPNIKSLAHEYIFLLT